MHTDESTDKSREKDRSHVKGSKQQRSHRTVAPYQLCDNNYMVCSLMIEDQIETRPYALLYTEHDYAASYQFRDIFIKRMH